MKSKILSLIAVTLLIALSAGPLFALGNSGSGGNTITIATKNFTENIVLGNIIAELISAQDNTINVNLKDNMGSSFVVWTALQSGDIDIYPDYTGTIYQSYLKQEKRVSADESLSIVQQQMKSKYQMKVFAPFGLNNTYAIAMLRNRAEELGITKISDLIKHPNLVAGFDSEFISRTADGSTPMYKAYGFKPAKPIVQLEIGLRYKAIIENQADYTDAYATDAKLKRFDMKILEDDKAFFPPYYAVTIARQDALDRFPGLGDLLAQLEGIISDSDATTMNYDVEENKVKPKEVAIKFLKSKGLIK